VSGAHADRFDPRKAFDWALWAVIALQVVRVVLHVVAGEWFDVVADLLVGSVVTMVVLGLPDPGES
jgi:hypothetical protein